MAGGSGEGFRLVFETVIREGISRLVFGTCVRERIVN